SVSAGAGAAEPTTDGSFTLNFSTPATNSTDINFAFTGTASFGPDYTVSYSTGSTVSTTASGTLTVPAGTSVVTVTITPVDDVLVEGAENIALTISSPTQGYTPGTSVANISLADNDVPTVSVSAGADAAEPATQGSFILTLSDPAPAGGVTVNYTLSGSATLNTDYSDPQSGSITIPAGNISGSILMNTIDDAVYEGTETLLINLTGASNGFAIATAAAAINITDDDPLPAIVINEVYGGGGNSGADYKNDFIELYNPTGTAVSLNGWSVQYGSATGASWSGKSNLTGSIPAHGYFLVQESAGTGGTLDLPVPDATGTISLSGTAGKVALVASTTALSGACPASSSFIDLVGFGLTANCFEGAAPAVAPSNTTSVQRSPKGFDSNNNNTDFIVAAPTPRNSVVDSLPPVITSLSPADDATGVATSFTASITFNENIQKVSGNITIKKTADGSTIKIFDVAAPEVSAIGPMVSFSVNSLAFNTGYYIEISAGAFKDGDDNAIAGISGASAWNFTTSPTPPAGILGIPYSFNSCGINLPDGFTQFNITGQQTWACSAFGRDAANPPSGNAPNGLGMNGFANGIDNTNEDWLISPSFDLTGTNFPLLSFWSRTAFAGATLQLKVSTDYSGTGDPTLSNWTDINGKFPGQVTDVWTLSQDINLSAYKTANTYFAFVYTSTSEDGARWTLDDITVTNSPTPPPPSLTISATDLQYTFVANGSTADKTFSFTGNDLTGPVDLASTGAFLLSKDGNAFSATLNYTVAEANDIPKTVFVRFAPAAANQNYSGIVTITTNGVASDTINLKGTSIDPATTLEVVNWNMEWFGSPVLGPVDDNLQQQNASIVLNTIGADIYGVVEIVDETRLQNVVNSLNATYGAGTYNYIICNYGSHVNPPDPAGGPLSAAQKEAFIYKTALFSNITTRALINNTDINSTSYNSWSSGRYPFLMTADVTLNCITKKINFVLLHSKANTAPTATAYARRQAGANE
ncbi:MAG: choice-of-anchor J domain-containing protein, partial [Ferruginibacter sp.]